MKKTPAVDLGVQSNPQARTRRLANGKSILTAPVVAGTIRSVGGRWTVSVLTSCPACSASVQAEVAISAALIPGSTVKGRRFRIERDPDGEMTGLVDTPVSIPIPPPTPPK